MSVTRVTASLTVSDLEAAVTWYAQVFGREPDTRPMDGLAEWQFADAAAVQIFAEPDRAGGSSAVLGVDDLDAQLAALDAAGIAHEPATDATFVRLATVDDPDHNRIVLTEPRS